MTRYRRAAELEDLIVQLRASVSGLTIEDMQQRYDVSRRTAERMRDAIGQRFELIEVPAGYDRRKRWKIEGQRAISLVRWTHDDVAAVESALKLAEQNGRQQLADELREVSTRIRASL